MKTKIISLVMALILSLSAFSVVSFAEGWSDPDNPMPDTCSFGWETGEVAKKADLEKDYPNAEFWDLDVYATPNSMYSDGKIHANHYLLMHEGNTFNAYVRIENATKHRIRLYGIKGFAITGGTVLNQYATLAKDDIRFDQDVDLAAGDVAFVEIDFNPGTFKRNENMHASYIACRQSIDQFVYKVMD